MAITDEKFWNKGKLCIDRALRYRDGGDYAQFQFWASVAMELIGKACLCQIHPVLVVDPENFKSVRIAVGNVVSDEYKTITANTLYNRLHDVVDGFDDKAKAYCGRMAERRNVELHSSELAFEGIDLRAWQNQYWALLKLLSESQGRSLALLLGPEEEEQALAIISDGRKAIEAAVKGKMQRSLANLKKDRTPGTLKSVLDSSKRECEIRADETGLISACPACQGWGLLKGTEVDSSFEEYVPGEYGTAKFTVFCDAEAFHCYGCGLRLHGVDELTVAELATEFETWAEREFEYEPDYGND